MKRLAVLLALFPALASAQDSGLEDVLGGFEDAPPTAAKPPPEASDWQVSGSLTGSSAYNIDHVKPTPGEVDHRGLSKARAKLNLKLKGKLNDDWRLQADGYAAYDDIYRIKGRNDFPSQVVADQETDKQLGEAYLQGRVRPEMDLTLGRQIVVWGKSDTLRVTDVLNPLDMRESGMSDVQDLRLPLSMARADYYLGDWSLTGIVIPEIRFNRLAAYGSDYHIASLASGNEITPSSGMDNAEWAGALNGHFTGWDVAFYGASHYSDMGTKNATMIRHARLNMAGGAVNAAVGNWLLKAEGAVQDGLRFQALPLENYTRGDVLLGADYSGLTDATVTFEIADYHLFGYDSALDASGAKRDDWQAALRYQETFLHETLTFNALAAIAGLNLKGGGYTRASLDYKVDDAVTVSGGGIIYQGGNHLPYNAIGDNDRLFAEVKWSF